MQFEYLGFIKVKEKDGGLGITGKHCSCQGGVYPCSRLYLPDGIHLCSAQRAVNSFDPRQDFQCSHRVTGEPHREGP